METTAPIYSLNANCLEQIFKYFEYLPFLAKMSLVCKNWNETIKKITDRNPLKDLLQCNPIVIGDESSNKLVLRIAFDVQQIAFTVADWDLNSYNIATEQKLIFPQQHFAYNKLLKFVSNSLLMTGGDSCVLQVWDISKKDPTSITANAVTKLSTFKHAFYSNVHKGKVAFTSVHSNEIKILDGEKQLSPIPILDEGEVKTTKGISLMEDRVFLAYELEDQSFVDSYTLVDGKKALTQSFGDKIFFICVDKDYLVINQKDALKILDPHSLEIKRSLDFPNNEKKSLKIVEINHDEVVAVVHKTIFLWDVHTGKLSQTWTMDDPIRHISLSEDFVAIVSEYDMSSAKTTIWHRKSGQLVKEITCKDVPASVALELNPQYKMLAIGMRNGQLELRSYPPTKV